MEIEIISNLLNKIQAEESNYEFENFFLESFTTPARQLLGVMQEIESLHAQNMIIGSDIEEKLSRSDFKDFGEVVLLHRKKNVVEKKLKRLILWYSNFDEEEVKIILGNFDEEEPEHWANHLGRKSAIEILSTGKISEDTFDQLTRLPVKTFENAISICSKYSRLIKETIESADITNAFISKSGVVSTR